MAQASRNLRKLRRIKRERTLAYKMVEVALKQRDVARQVADFLAKELRKKEEPEAVPVDPNADLVSLTPIEEPTTDVKDN